MMTMTLDEMLFVILKIAGTILACWFAWFMCYAMTRVVV